MATKTAVLSIKVTEEERQQIIKKAEEADVSVSKYLYRIVFGKKPKAED